MTATWTPEKDGVQFLNADLARHSVRNVSVCRYAQDWTAIALAFPLASEEPCWEQTFPSIEAARAAAEAKYGFCADAVVPVNRIEFYGARA